MRRRFSDLTRLRNLRTTRQQNRLLPANSPQTAAQTLVQSLALGARAAAPGAAFEASPLLQLSSGVFDLGVVDINNDDIFDVFMTRHNVKENLLLGSASGQFTDVLTQLGLDQDRQFPGLNNFDVKPAATPGLNIYRQRDGGLYFDFHRTRATRKPVTGEIVVPSPKHAQQASVVLLKRHRARVKIWEHPWRHGRQTHIQFKVRPNGQFVLGTRFLETQYSVKLNRTLPLSQIHIGADQIHPRRHRFTFHLHDRHGMAWADFQGDSRIDVFISRGGMVGEILNFPDVPPIRDELFVNQGNGRFEDRAARLGFEKQGCRARKVAWVDFNQDGRLDLYIAGKLSPNQLFQQQPNGHFRNVAVQKGVNFRDSGPFEWIDTDNDHDLDLLVARQGRITLYRNQAGQLNLFQSIPFPGQMPRKLTFSDYDRDGDFDVYAASIHTSQLLINSGGRYSAVDPTTVGLPGRALTANWVDYDNDGWMDLHTLPGKLYRQLPNHQFMATDLLNQDYPTWPEILANREYHGACANWFDMDNNGTRDVLYTTAPSASGQMNLYRNLLTQNHWLQLKLVGPKGNQQAIGATVALTTAEFRQVQQVGQSEGSHESQGHYRLYFGLGQQQTGGTLQITWPDGRQQTVQYERPDQLLTVQYPQR